MIAVSNACRRSFGTGAIGNFLRHLRASRKRCPGGAPMQKRVLNDAYIRALKPAAPGTRYAVSDILVPGLRVRVTDQGTKTFIL